MNYVFQTEEFNDGLIEEMMPLLQEHYLEISHYKDIPLNPDYETYKRVFSLGLMRVFTARNLVDSKLIGYNVMLIRNNMHYKDSLQAVQDIIYIDKTKRGFGLKFISWCDDELRKQGIQVVYQHMKAAQSFGPMLERMGYELVDLIFAKRLDK